MYHVQLEDFGKLFAPEFDQLEIDAEFEKEIFSLSALKVNAEFFSSILTNFPSFLLFWIFFRKIAQKLLLGGV